MGKGTCHELLRIANQEGLSDLLAGNTTVREVVHETEAENLSFISRGTLRPNPSELLMGKRFEKLMEEVTREYDMVIMDTPPILAVTDAAVVGRYAGTTMLVARFGLNPANEITLAKRRLEVSPGVVFCPACWSREITDAIFSGLDLLLACSETG